MNQLIECVPNFSEGADLNIIKQITDAIETVEGVRLLNVDPGKARSGIDRPALDGNVSSECWQRAYLLRIHVDTANKIANVGSGTGWMLEADKARGSPQLFMMQFESIRQSVNRLRQMI